jgi:hypothetical protein
MEQLPQIEEDVALPHADTVRQLANGYLPANHANGNHRVSLVQAEPRNELDSITNILYEHTDLPLRTLQSEVLTWPYQRKLDVFSRYLLETGPAKRSLQTMRYTFDASSDYRTLRNLERHQLLHALTRQPLSPRQGYDTPALAEAASLSDIFDDCFDLSLQLYSALQAAEHREEAQYAVLLGHKVQWGVTCTAVELFAADTTYASSPERLLIEQMREAAGEVHPLFAEAMQNSSLFQSYEPRPAKVSTS